MEKAVKSPAADRTLLIVEDDVALRGMLVEMLESLDYTILQAGSLAEAREALSRSFPPVILLDIGLPDGSGLDLLPEFLGKDPCHIAIVLTAQTDEATIVKATQMGIMQFLTKPFATPDLHAAVKRAFEKSRECRKVFAGREAKDAGPKDLLIGRNPKMMAVKMIVGKLSPHGTPVLITGEQGTEKTAVAKALHAYGPMAREPFEVLDCKTLSPPQMETRLFGAPGNGATSAEKGNGPELKPRGTVLLNDAECLPAGIQCKLVQVLRRHVAGTPVSSTKAKPVCRILAATSADPADIATQKLLCEELYFQLSSSVIHLPPLRERLDDVPLLVEAFLADLSKEREAPLRISAEALEVMRTYPWPGNVRELERMLVHCSLLGTSVVGPEDLPEYLQLPRPEKAALTIALDMEQNVVPLQEVDRRYAAQVLKVCRGVKIRAAKLLKIDRHTLESLIRPLLGKHGGKKPSRQGRKK